MTKSVYSFFVLWLLLKHSLLLDVSSDYIFISTTYCLYYKKKLGITKLTKKLITNLATFTFTYNSNGCTDQLGLIA